MANIFGRSRSDISSTQEKPSFGKAASLGIINDNATTCVWVWNVQNTKPNKFAEKTKTIQQLIDSADTKPSAIFLTEILGGEIEEYLLAAGPNFLKGYQNEISDLFCDSISRKEYILVYYLQGMASLIAEDLASGKTAPTQQNVDYGTTSKTLRGRTITNPSSKQRNGISILINKAKFSVVHFRGPSFTDTLEGKNATETYFSTMVTDGVDCIIGDMNIRSGTSLDQIIGNAYHIVAPSLDQSTIARGDKQQTVTPWDRCVVSKNFIEKYEHEVKIQSTFNQDRNSIDHPLISLTFKAKINEVF